MRDGRVFEREHDIKVFNENLRETLLKAHEGFSKLLEQDLGEDIEKRVIRIEQSVDSVTSALKKINQMIVLNTYGANRWKKVELSIGLKESINKLEKKAKLKNQKIEFINETTRAISYGDNIIFEEFIFDNLISNAIKFSPNDSVISIKLDSDKNYNIFTISDRGVGIKQEDIKKINSILDHHFTPDTQGNSGSGMSFPIISQILKKLNGHLEVESSTTTTEKRERGTKVTLRFHKF